MVTCEPLLTRLHRLQVWSCSHPFPFSQRRRDLGASRGTSPGRCSVLVRLRLKRVRAPHGVPCTSVCNSVDTLGRPIAPMEVPTCAVIARVPRSPSPRGTPTSNQLAALIPVSGSITEHLACQRPRRGVAGVADSVRPLISLVETRSAHSRTHDKRGIESGGCHPPR